MDGPYIGMLAIHTSEVHTSELQCMDPPMVANVGVFQVAEAPMYGYDYALPEKTFQLCLRVDSMKNSSLPQGSYPEGRQAIKNISHSI